MPPFQTLQREAREWLSNHPADIWRLRCSMRVGADGYEEDDMRAFFIGRNPWEVADADIWRWRASCRALREMQPKPKTE